ncbi:hypothetical protein C8K63_105115 [Pseudomonas sp. GV085]|nr:hypothetical protein C8K63_105115 [Pseudomonas sp. GV085]
MGLKALRLFRKHALSLASIASELAPTEADSIHSVDEQVRH